MAQTDKQTDRQTDGHGNSMTESAQWADSVKIHLGNISVTLILSMTYSLANIQTLTPQ